LNNKDAKVYGWLHSRGDSPSSNTTVGSGSLEHFVEYGSKHGYTFTVKSNTFSIRAEQVGLPPLPPWRRIVRRLLKGLSQFLVWLCTHPEVRGLENIPKQGPVLIVINHLGDADAILGLAYAPVCIDTLAKRELYDIPIIGALMHAYGIIWLQRGVAYRHVLCAVLDGLAEGRFICIAPEGRVSLTGALEKGTDGSAYLALKLDVLLLPVAITGTENRRIFDNLKHMRRTAVTVTIGQPFRLETTGDRRKDIAQGTLTIMRTLARQLPSEYRGVYQTTSPILPLEQHR
jgi:1-acyl-sn-glycerol-3-phosphate acyltransferase